MHFLSSTYALMTIEELQRGVNLHVTPQDFLLGVADLTGEVMRCIQVEQIGLSKADWTPADTASTASDGWAIRMIWHLSRVRWQTLSDCA